MHAALARLDYGRPSAPDILVIGSRPEIALADVHAVEARCSACIGLDAAPAHLDRATSFDMVLLDAGDADGERLAPIFERLRRGAEEGRFTSVAILPFDAVDLAFGMLDSPAIRLVIEPDALERRAALAAALPSGGPLRVLDGGADATRAEGSDLLNEVASIAKRLAALAATEPVRAPAADARVDAGTVRGIIRARRLRDQYFDGALFADPAWDMLLDLCAARLEGRDVAVSSLCIAAAVPPTTALRWIKILTDAGLLVRRADPADRRRIFIALGEDAADAMLCYLAAAQRGGGLTI